MQDQHSTSNDNQEPPRPRTIPDDFIWNPEYEAWFAPGVPSDLPPGYFSERLDEILKKIAASGERRGLISVHELRAAGALNGPAARRKSLSRKSPGRPREQRDLFSDLSDADDALPEKQPPTTHDPDSTE